MNKEFPQNIERSVKTPETILGLKSRTESLLQKEIQSVPETREYFTSLEQEIERRENLVNRFISRNSGTGVKYFSAPFVTDRTDLGNMSCSALILASEEQPYAAEDVYIQYENTEQFDLLDIRPVTQGAINKMRYPEMARWYLEKFSGVLNNSEYNEQPLTPPITIDDRPAKEYASLEYKTSLKEYKLKVVEQVVTDLRKHFPNIQYTLSGSLSEAGYRHSIGSDIDLDLVVPKHQENAAVDYVEGYLKFHYAEKYNVMLDIYIQNPESKIFSPVDPYYIKIYENKLEVDFPNINIAEKFKQLNNDPFRLAEQTTEILPKPSWIPEDVWSDVMKYRTPQNYLTSGAKTVDKRGVKDRVFVQERIYYHDKTGAKIVSLPLLENDVSEYEMRGIGWEDVWKAFEKDTGVYCPYCDNLVYEENEVYSDESPAGSNMYHEQQMEDHYSSCEKAQGQSWLTGVGLAYWEAMELLELAKQTNQGDYFILETLLERGFRNIQVPEDMFKRDDREEIEAWFDFQKEWVGTEDKSSVPKPTHKDHKEKESYVEIDEHSTQRPRGGGDRRGGGTRR